MEKGLTTTEVLELQKKYGRNEITSQEKNSPLTIFLSQFPTIMNGILLLAGIFSFVINDYLDAFFIFAILFLNGIVGFIQEYKAEKSLEKLKNFIKPECTIVRNGEKIQISTRDIVPGDIVILSEGDRIPADGILLTDTEIETDESILTGESLPVVKKQKDEMFNGTLIVKGKGYLQVTTIGNSTRFGKIAETLSTLEDDNTPLKKRLDHLGKILSVIALIFAFLLIPIGFFQNKDITPIILLAISISVAAIPQSLPTVVTITLALGTHVMATKKAIVRKMPAIETLGAVQIIIVDKTGTLTENKMKVKKFWMTTAEHMQDMIFAATLGNTATLIQKENKNQFEVVGDKTDGALILWARENAQDWEELKTKGKVIDEFVFDSRTKTITTIWQTSTKILAYVRGAPEEILKKSTISSHEKQKVNETIEEYAKEGLRVIALASRHLPSGHPMKREKIEEKLTFLGVIGIYDPPRDEAKSAVQAAKEAGISPIMVTGDNEHTALAIAKDIGLIEKDEDVITGEELGKITDEELGQIISRVRVFARATPEDKLRLATFLKKQGFVVGVTGDGVNDALALKRADVGVAMGESGTDVAKEASDIIITDDNFATLIKAVEEGRTIYKNILKAVAYLLSGNLAELSLVFFAALFGLPNPLLPTQILWINLVTDGFPALALASDGKDANTLKSPPRDPNSPILTRRLLTFICVTGFSLSISLLVLFNYLLGIYPEVFARTVVFNLLIVAHLAIAFVVRGRSIFKRNNLLFITIAISLLLQYLINKIPFFQNIFHLGF